MTHSADKIAVRSGYTALTFGAVSYTHLKHCELPCFYMRVGIKDFLLDKCRYAKAQLETYGYELDYAEIEGYGHEWRFWDLVLNEVISTWL